jgi:Tfp pilus assembly protein PilV
MRSSDASRRLRAQRGTSLVEALVASTLLAIGVVAGVTAWDTATISARTAVRQAWARCIVRSELDAILSARWQDDNYAAPPGVTVTAPIVRGSAGSANEERLVTVVAKDPQSSVELARVSALKLRALEGQKSMGTLQDDGVGTDVYRGCPSP